MEGAAWSVLVLYARQRPGMGAVGFGLITTAMAVGGLAGTASSGWLERRVRLGVIMRAGLIISHRAGDRVDVARDRGGCGRL